MTTSILVPAICVELSKKINLLWETKKPKSIVYIVGNGWGAYHFIKNLDKKKYYPIVIAPNYKVLDTPRLTNIITNYDTQIEFDNPYWEEYIKATVIDIDHLNKQLILSTGHKINYNKVIFSIGSEPNDFGIEGVNLYAFKFKTINDAIKIRKHINNMKPNSKVYIVGSGVTGVELGSKLNCLNNQIKIIEGLESILPGFSSNTKLNIFNKIQSDYPNITIDLNTLVKSIEKSSEQTYTLKTLKTYSGKQESILQSTFINMSDIIIWTGGIRFNGYKKTKLFESLNNITPIKPRGLNVNLDFTIGTNTDIYCIGDMVANAGPPTAQNARLHGEWLAQYFNSRFDPEYLKSNEFKSNITTKIIHLDKHIWLESEIFSGFVPNFIDKIIKWISK